MKNAPRRRPEVEPLESRLVLSTLVIAPHPATSITIVPEGSAQVASLTAKAQAPAHPGGVTLTINRTLLPGQSARLGAVTARALITPGQALPFATTRLASAGPRVTIIPGHFSTTATATPRALTRFQPGPALAGNVHAMIVPSASRPIVITTVTSTAPPATPQAKAEALFAAEHPALGGFR